jgi:hypothetical protein
MPRPGIRLPLRNNPGRYPRRSRILSCEFMAKLGTMSLDYRRDDKSSKLHSRALHRDARAYDFC